MAPGVGSSELETPAEALADGRGSSSLLPTPGAIHWMCSSELETPAEALADARLQGAVIGGSGGPVQDRVAGVAQIRYAQVRVAALVSSDAFGRSEERRVGEECRYR